MTVISTQTATFSYIRPDIILVKIKEDAEIDLLQSQHNFTAILQLAQGHKYATLVDARVHASDTPESRAFSSHPDRQKPLIAMAIIVDSLPNKLIANFLIKFNKPSSPTRLFSDPDAALNWLTERVNEHNSSLAY